MTHLRPYWTARLADARKPRFPMLRDDLSTDVVIVGGGLVGCASACVFASAGVRVVLLEAKRVGQQATAAAPGVILPEPAVALATLDAMHGRRAARAIWAGARHAGFDFAALLRRLGARADLDAVELADYVGLRDNPREIEREGGLRQEMGIEGQYLARGRGSAQLKADVSGAIRVKAGGVFDPYRASLALLRAARSARAKVFESSPVVKIQDDDTRTRHDGGVRVITTRGSVSASHVIVATGGPTRPLFQPLARRFTSLVSYRVLTEPLPAPLRRQMPAAIVLREVTVPGHVLRWTRDGRLLFAGVERLRLPERSRPAALVQHSAQLMYELSLLYPHLSGIQAEYAWDALVYASDDGLPYIGPHRHYPNHLFALGAGRADGATALLAARILLRQYTGTVEKADALWGFGR